MKKSAIFTEKEYELIKQYSVKQSALHVFSFYFLVLLTPFIFAVYGVVNRDFIAVLVAFAGLLVFIIWLLLPLVKNGELLSGICEKILEQEILKTNEDKTLE